MHSIRNRSRDRGNEVEKEVAEIITRLGLVDAVDEAVYATALQEHEKAHKRLSVD